MTDDNIIADIDGGPVRHIPVMLNEVLSVLEPAPGKIIVDGTFGAGGYSSAILAQGANVIAFDRDPDAIRNGQDLQTSFPDRLRLIEDEFSNMAEYVSQVDGLVLDIGVSSMQLDEGERGFSFRSDGPLDMRMSQSGVSAADVVNQASRSDLTRIIGILGEERKASIVSKAIVEAREVQCFTTTAQLARLVEKTLVRKAQDRIHPATRTFQALRMFVNGELEQLGRALFAAERILKEGGRLVVVTFHSLEDRLVKVFFKDRQGAQQNSRHMPEVKSSEAVFEAEGKALLKPSEEEISQNPRARSAKLRWGARTEVAAPQPDLSIFGLPNLAQLKGFKPEGVVI